MYSAICTAMPASSRRKIGRPSGSAGMPNSASTPAPRLNTARSLRSRSNKAAGGFQTAAMSASCAGASLRQATTSASGSAAASRSRHTDCSFTDVEEQMIFNFHTP